MVKQATRKNRWKTKDLGVECSGSGTLPTTKTCYEGNLLVETFKVELLNSDGSSGALNMEARPALGRVRESRKLAQGS